MKVWFVFRRVLAEDMGEGGNQEVLKVLKTVMRCHKESHKGR